MVAKWRLLPYNRAGDLKKEGHGKNTLSHNLTRDKDAAVATGRDGEGGQADERTAARMGKNNKWIGRVLKFRRRHKNRKRASLVARGVNGLIVKTRTIQKLKHTRVV